MPRPQKHRWVAGRPCATHFKPQGIPWCELEEVILTIEELEAVRLKDAEGLEQEECARQMQISRPTFVRLIQSSRKKIALALTEGKGLRIEGGHHKFYGKKGSCKRNGACHHRRSEVEDDSVRGTEDSVLDSPLDCLVPPSPTGVSTDEPAAEKSDRTQGPDRPESVSDEKE